MRTTRGTLINDRTTGNRRIETAIVDTRPCLVTDNSRNRAPIFTGSEAGNVSSLDLGGTSILLATGVYLSDRFTSALARLPLRFRDRKARPKNNLGFFLSTVNFSSVLRRDANRRRPRRRGNAEKGRGRGRTEEGGKER